MREQCRTTMFHIDMNLYRLMVYAQSIEESNLRRITRNLKRRKSDEKNLPKYKKSDQT